VTMLYFLADCPVLSSSVPPGTRIRLGKELVMERKLSYQQLNERTFRSFRYARVN